VIFARRRKFFCGNLRMGLRKILQTRAALGRVILTEVFRTEVDFEQVLYRLGAARSKFVHRRGMPGARPVVLPGGDSADLASATLLKLLDPLDTSITWSPTKGPPTTAGVLAYLREVLRRDFLDFIRSKRATTSVYPDDERADGQGLSGSTIDQRVASYGNPEDEHLQSERLVASRAVQR
jgi:hypothetical protein